MIIVVCKFIMVNIDSVFIKKLIKKLINIVLGVYGKMIGIFNVGLELGISFLVIFWNVGMIFVNII